MQKETAAHRIKIRPATEQDIAKIAAIEKSSIPDPWSEEGFRDALRQPGVIFLVTEDLSGYCVLYTAADEGEIPTIAVDQEHRRKGIAQALLLSAGRMAVQQGVKRIYLEVRKSNEPARCLYEHCGFVRDGVRPRFYEHPQEDAVVMHLELCEKSIEE